MRGALDSEAGSFGAQQRGIAKELDGVAEAVKAAEHDAAVVPRGAVPEAVRVGGVPSAQNIVLLPGGFEVAEEHVALPAVAGTGRPVGTCGFGLVDGLEGGGDVTGFEVGPGEVEEGFGDAGLGGCRHSRMSVSVRPRSFAVFMGRR